jgi:hypothetical protein
MTGLPQVPGAPQAPSQVQTAPGRPPGRPPADPEQAERREAAHLEKKRLLSILPKQAVDAKIRIFRKIDGRTATKPAVVVLCSDLERSNVEGVDSQEFLIQSITEKVRDPDGYYEARVVDRQNRPVGDVAPFEIKVGNPPEDDEDLDGDPVDDPGDDQDLPQVPPNYRGEPIPPPVSGLPPSAFADAFRAERQDEAKRGNEVLGVVTTMMNQSQNIFMQMMASMQQQAQAAAAQAARDAREREDRERERKADFNKTLLALVPVILPVLQGLFKKEDTMTPLLIEMVKAKPDGAQMIPQVMSMMAESMKASSQMQTAAAQASMEQQARVSGTLMDSMLERTLKLAGMGQPEAPKEDGLIDQIAKLAPIIGPILAAKFGGASPEAMAAAQAQAQPQPMAALPAPVQQPQQRSPAPVPPPPVLPQQTARQPPQQEPPPADEQGPPAQTDNQKTQACVATIAQMYAGRIPPTERPQVLPWIAEHLPDDLREAVKAGDREKVIGLATPAVLEAEPLAQWIAKPTSLPFLEATIADVGLILRGQMTAERMAAGIAEHAESLRRRGGRPRKNQQQSADQAPPAQANPDPAKADQPTTPAGQDAGLPVIAGDAPVLKFTNSTAGQVTVPVEVLTDKGWVEAAPPYQTMPVPEGGTVQGPVLEENDASWVVMLSSNGRVRVAKDKFRRTETP